LGTISTKLLSGSMGMMLLHSKLMRFQTPEDIATMESQLVNMVHKIDIKPIISPSQSKQRKLNSNQTTECA
jgi:hypothetical protein